MRYIFKDGKYRQVLPEDPYEVKGHNHEVLGTVQVANVKGCPHTHRFATVSGEAVREGTDHRHEVRYITDTYEGHHHEFCGMTETSVKTCDRHVHFLKGTTSENAGHKHGFQASTLIEDPIGK
ncbi:MAG TPA: hypothetical protein DDZ89_05655 [Clostridiales bacterium]|nr:hypothetical protein [Clostridiales bacterium]